MCFRKQQQCMIGIGIIMLINLGLILGVSGLSAQPVDGLNKEKIAVLESFAGELTIKSNGLWGAVPTIGMDLHHGDKIVSHEAATAIIRFLDDSVLEVKSNSVVRIAENVIKGGYGKKDEKRREVRLFIGKERYQSSEHPSMQTVLVAPAAVAALRGTEVWFGTDGKRSFFDQVTGGKELKGNISEGFVPEISKQQAAADLNYKSSLDAHRVWIKYLRTAAKAGLFAENDYLNLYLASSSMVAHDGALASAGGSNENAVELMGLLAEYALFHTKETENENTSLLNHPDNNVFDRAVKALNESKIGLARAQEAFNFNLMLKRKAKQRLQTWKRYDQTKRSVIFNLLKVKQKTSEVYEFSALISMLSAEEYTIGLPETGLTIKHLWPEMEKTLNLTTQDYEKARDIADRLLAVTRWGKADEASAKLLELYASSAAANAAVASVIVKAAQSMIAGDELGAKRFMDLISETLKIRNELNEINKQAENLIRDPGEIPGAIDHVLDNLDNLIIEAGKKTNTIPIIAAAPFTPEISPERIRELKTEETTDDDIQKPQPEKVNNLTDDGIIVQPKQYAQ